MHRNFPYYCLLYIGFLLVILPEPAPKAQGQSANGVYSPKIAPASDEWKQAIRRIRVPEGLKVDLFAAEPMLANPVCFCVDEKNRFYVAETFRYTAGVTDSRDHMDWLDDDLACRTVEDRLALLRKHLGSKFSTFEIEHDRIRMIEDTNGSGRADRATVFADGFHGAAEGIGAGLLARRGNVWYTCIPNLWLLRDTYGDGKIDVRKSLHYGYGVHGGFIGHDLHGLRMGPDGKIYFSRGDRGLNVKTEGRVVASPDAGAVLRCNPDGSELELVATGLRIGIKEVSPALFGLLADKRRPAAVRIEALLALQTLDDSRLPQAMELALNDEDTKPRMQGCRVLAKHQPAEAVIQLAKVLEGGTMVERQGALTILGEMNLPAADQVLSRWLDRLLARQVPIELQLDLLLAAGRHAAKDIKMKLAKYEAARFKSDPLANFQEALAGGDAEAGKKIFFHKGEVACLRCHKVKGEGGEVGPDLTGIGSRQKRDYLLEAIVDPNKQIAQGFETVVVTMTNGQVHTGIIKAEDAKEVRLMTPEGQLLTLSKAKIEERSRGPSAMPADIIQHLTKSELRDLVEFLAGLR